MYIYTTLRLWVLFSLYGVYYFHLIGIRLIIIIIATCGELLGSGDPTDLSPPEGNCNLSPPLACYYWPAEWSARAMCSKEWKCSICVIAGKPAHELLLMEKPVHTSLHP